MKKKTLRNILYNGIERSRNENIDVVIDDMTKDILFGQKKKTKTDNTFVQFVMTTVLSYFKSFYRLLFEEFFRNFRKFKQNEISYSESFIVSVRTFTKSCSALLLIMILIDFSLESFSPIVSIFMLMILFRVYY